MGAVMNPVETVFQAGPTKIGIADETELSGNRSAEAWKVEVVKSVLPFSSVYSQPCAETVSGPLGR
jgi:hypothetical protein